MKKYKGFLLENGESTYEEREWSGGHSSEGTGRYTTSYWTRVTDLKTLKNAYFSNENEAKLWIDSRKENKKKNRELLTKIKNLEKRIQTLEEKKDRIQHTIYGINGAISKLREGLSKELT